MVVFFARIVLILQLIVLIADWLSVDFSIDNVVYLTITTAVLFVLVKAEKK